MDALLSPTRLLTLSPDNDLAQDVVAKCASIIMADSDSHKHHRQFLESIESEANTDAEEIAAVPLGSAIGQIPISGANKERHRFVLDLSQERTGPFRSWVIGRGSSKLKDRNVDILVKASKAILPAPVVALIWVEGQSGAFILKAVSPNCPIQYLSGLGSGGDLTLQRGDQCVLWMKRNRLRFGLRQLDFVLDVAIEHEARYTVNRAQYFSQGDGLLPNVHLDVVPKDEHQRTNNYIIHRKILAAGSFGRISVGVNATNGLPVAIKVAHSKRLADTQDLKNEIRIAGLLSPHPNIVPFLDTWCSHGDSPPCSAYPLDDYYMAMPLAEQSFESFFTSYRDTRLRLKLFQDVTKGLAHIHSRGVMHRDISPKNLLVTLERPGISASSWIALICDFGKAIQATGHHATGIGPIHTVAPEVWNFQPGVPRGQGYQYTSAIDVWSLGYAHLYILRQPKPLEKTDRKRHSMLMQILDDLCTEDHIEHDEKSHVQNLLSMEPGLRPTAQAALAHPMWETSEWPAPPRLSLGSQQSQESDGAILDTEPF
ncbi:Uu.00g024630.m01.CDS01 [Anthostomella pinea]|uniref:EKC/KEOPS complex subunit BUD32 n=1 Tax=Anthostomella pinea TaxID=933095 RepID=A0AAI8YR11_9PEZI|nr:Uu.00g024630.m01.CDS01 [Anthostomella pinea]